MRRTFSFFLLTFIGFLDYLGFGLVLPLFPALIFEPHAPLFSPEVPLLVRGFWMGLLISLGPLAQFFLAPLFGSLSDQKGRRPILCIGLSCAAIGYGLGILGVMQGSLLLLFFYRLFYGFSAATSSVIWASLADISPPNGKGDSFAWYSMAQGLGWTIGPFIGGRLSDGSICPWFSLSTPLLFGLLCALMNLGFLSLFFRETNRHMSRGSVDWLKGIKQSRRAFNHPILGLSFLGMFFFLCGWDYFEEFIGVYLSQALGFSTGKMGNYFGMQGLSYALSAGILIRPLLRRFAPSRLLIVAMAAGAAAVLPTAFLGSEKALWIFAPILMFCGALFFPTASTYISSQAKESEQGELLGIYDSIYALALVLTPFITGTLAGAAPKFPIYLGSGLMLVGSCVFAWGHALRKRGFPLPHNRENVHL